MFKNSITDVGGTLHQSRPSRATSPQKTRRPVQFEITEPTRDSVLAWIAHSKLKPEDFLFPSRIHASPQLSTRQCAQIVDPWVQQSGLDASSYGTHTLRRQKALTGQELTFRPAIGPL
jgi:hypothetical protein